MQVVIVGPGSIGLLLYGFLSKSKEDIWLLDKSCERAARIKKNGIKIEGQSSIMITSPKITSDPAEVNSADLWIIAVKSYDTKSVIKRIAPHVSSKSYVMSLQNGVGNVEILCEQFGTQKALIGVTNMGATIISEGVVSHKGEGETIVGRLDGQLSVELKDLRELFQKSKMQIKLSKDIQAVIWSKLVINVGINAISALTRLTNGRITEFEGTRRIFKDAITEAIKVAKRKRIKLLYDDPVSKAESVCEATSENISSMLSDVLRKKRTEIDFLNGAIVRQGESLGIKTPVNLLLVDLIKTLESSYSYIVAS
ncbi:MAG TPA: 2-dehydropantoate 2-reductase, partial [Candidatus Omnitrophota bacterium]|nr:2-dehydropantoate 2-reductase [Candidatus Omnitrophota bacterium]